MRTKLIATLLTILISVGAVGVISTSVVELGVPNANNTIVNTVQTPEEIDFYFNLPTVIMTLSANKYMTWDRWLGSDYSKDLVGFSTVSSGGNEYVIYGDEYVYTRDKAVVKTTDKISDNDSFFIYDTMEEVVFPNETIYTTFRILPDASGIYVAEDKMTWVDYCESKYNTMGFYISGDNVLFDTPQGVTVALYKSAEYNGKVVSASESIIFECVYELQRYEQVIDSLLYYTWTPNSTIDMSNYNLTSKTYDVIVPAVQQDSSLVSLTFSVTGIKGNDGSGDVQLYTKSNNSWGFYIDEFTFIGGTSLTDRTLIAWLSNNGKLVKEDEPKFYGIEGAILTGVTLEFSEDAGERWNNMLSDLPQLSSNPGATILTFSNGDSLKIASGPFTLLYVTAEGVEKVLIDFDQNLSYGYFSTGLKLSFDEGVTIESVNSDYFNTNDGGYTVLRLFARLLYGE